MLGLVEQVKLRYEMRKELARERRPWSIIVAGIGILAAVSIGVNHGSPGWYDLLYGFCMIVVGIGMGRLIP